MEQLSRRSLIIGLGSMLAAPMIGGCGSGSLNSLGRAVAPILLPGLGSALGSILSGLFSLFEMNTSGQPLTTTVNLSGSAAETVSATISNVPAGAYIGVVSLYSGANGSGTLVAQTATTLTIAAGQTSMIPPVTTVGPATAISILPNQTEPVNQPATPLVSVMTGSQLLAVPPSSLTYANAGSSGPIILPVPNQVMATSPSSAMLTVTLDGVTSPPQTVTFS